MSGIGRPTHGASRAGEHDRASRRWTRVVLVMGLLALPVQGVAAQQAARGVVAGRCGSVDIVRVMHASPAASEARTRLERETRDRELELNRLQSRYERLRQRESAPPGSAAADSSRADHELVTLRRELLQARAEYAADLQMWKNEELVAVQTSVTRAVAASAAARGLDVVYVEAHAGTAGSGPLFAADSDAGDAAREGRVSCDVPRPSITADVIQRMRLGADR